jgi:DNA-binding response OmpR family regulator
VHAFGQPLPLAGYNVVAADSGEQALQKLAGSAFDIVITDLGMPGLSGLELLKYLRARDFDGEVILITGFASVESATQALRAGACDYLTKPVHRQELLESLTRARQKLTGARQRRRALAMMEAGLKQYHGDAAAQVEAQPSAPNMPKAAGRYRVGPILLDVHRFVIEVDGRRIDATASEFEILHYLCRNPDRVVTPEELVQSLRGYTIESGEAREVIRPHMSNLRRKLLMASQQADVIVTVRSMGYLLRMPPGEDSQGGSVVHASGTGGL